MDRLLTQVISVLEQLDPTVCLVITSDKLDLPGPIIVYANKAWLALTGYTLAEVVGKTPRILQGPLTDKSELKRLKECLLHEQRYIGTNINYKKDGTMFRMGWDTVKVTDETGENYFLAVQKPIAVLSDAGSDSAELANIKIIQEEILKTLHNVLPMQDDS